MQYSTFCKGHHFSKEVFIITDSTLNTVIETKEILNVIRKDAPGVPVWAIANKQDLEGALSPGLVGRILRIPAFGMVAIDQNRKEEMMGVKKEG
ncbi:MAG: hypothetical protein ACFFBU_01815 [Promethearchaeota archaeon]